MNRLISGMLFLILFGGCSPPDWVQKYNIGNKVYLNGGNTPYVITDIHYGKAEITIVNEKLGTESEVSPYALSKEPSSGN